MSLTSTSCRTLKPPALQSTNRYTDDSTNVARVTWKPCGSYVPGGLNSSWMGTDGKNIVFAKATSKLYRFTGSEWTEEPFPAGHYGGSLWSDGEHIYSSEENSHYVLNEETGEWEEKIWNGFTAFCPSVGAGNDIWTDGTNIYYSCINGGNFQYVLNKETDTWEEKTWNIDIQTGSCIWTDGTNIYYSCGSNQYILNTETGEWEEKVWEGLTDFAGSRVWSCGQVIYHSLSGVHHYLAPGESLWHEHLMSLMPVAFHGYDVWTDGNFIYITHGYGEHFVLLPKGTKMYSKNDEGWYQVWTVLL